MSFQQKLLRFTALSLSAALLLSGGALAAFDSAFSYSYQIGEGATYTRLEGKTSAGLQKASYIEYKPNTTVSPMIVYADEELYGSKSTITQAANYLKQQGYTPIGGINADFFVLGTSIPIGLVIRDGELISSDAWQYAVGFKADGTAVIGQPSSTMKIEGPSGAAWISYFNKTRTPAGIYLLDSNFDSTTHISTAGRSIVLERVDDAEVRVNGQVKLRVIAKGTGSGSTTITPNQMVLTMDDKCKATWVDFPVGEEVTLTVSAPNQAWNNVVYAVGGKNLIKDGAVNSSGIDGGSSAMPRTAVAVKDDGTVLMYEIDGRQSSLSTGLTAAQLGAELKSMGYNNAVCLDGGGSSALSTRLPGESEIKLATSPSDGSQRACANYIFLVNKATPDGIARNVQFRPSQYYILPGASTYFATWGSDQAYGPASLPSDMTYTVSAGSVDSATQIFTADMTPGVVTVSGTSADGSVTGSHQFCVTTGVDAIKLQSGGETVTSTSLRGAQTIDLDATAIHQGMQMAAKDELFTWTVSGDIGTIDAKGLFTANEKPASGKIICSYGAVSASINVTVGLSDPQNVTTIADFETAQPLDSELTLTQTRQFDQVARGSGALSVALAQKTIGDINAPRTVTDGMTYLSLYAKSTAAGTTVSALFTDDADQTIETPLTGLVSSGSFTLLSCQVPAEATAFEGLRVTSEGEGTLYLDHLLLSAQRLVNNTDAPAIQLTAAPTAVDAGKTATVSARISMESGRYVLRPANVTAYVDGVKASATYSPASAGISVTTGALSEGLHRVTIEAVDDAGNRARKSVDIVAGSASASKFSDTGGNWANGYINFAANRGIIQGETKDGKLYFNPARNLKRSEFAVIMARYLNLDTSDGANLSFGDTKSIPSWAAGAIKACANAGIMNGQLDTGSGKTNFNPNANITRAEVMTVLSKCLPRGYVASASSFTDAASIPSWAAEHVGYTVSAGLIGGYEDGSIKPLNNITRAEIAKVLCSLY